MAERPILFNTEMVRAILDGRKTQTRRILKNDRIQARPDPAVILFDGPNRVFKWNPNYYSYDDEVVRPPYRYDDILWVRETWNGVKLGQRGKEETHYWYRADEDEERLNPDDKWRPSIHMPKEAARIFLKVETIHAERLRSISPLDVKAEGIRLEVRDEYDLEVSQEAMERFEFETLWDSTVNPDTLLRYGWDANPWVWVIEFERTEKPKGWLK